ncbi:unnamed protein product, partial [Laminaria digitata]
RYLERVKKAVESRLEDLQRQEAGLEQQKEAASSLLRKAKVAHEVILEGEMKAEAARSELSNSRGEVERMRSQLSEAMSEVRHLNT